MEDSMYIFESLVVPMGDSMYIFESLGVPMEDSMYIFQSMGVAMEEYVYMYIFRYQNIYFTQRLLEADHPSTWHGIQIYVSVKPFTSIIQNIYIESNTLAIISSISSPTISSLLFF